MKKLLLTLLWIPSILGVHAQESAPVLGVGIDGVTAAKGNLDVALISEMVAQKQDELKKRFIQTTFSKTYQNENYALWEYAYNMLDVVLNVKGKEAIKKNTLEYTSNMALVYGITKLYVEVSGKYGNKDLFAFYSEFSAKKVNNDSFISSFQNLKKSMGKKEVVYANNVLLDMFYQILSENNRAISRGFFHTHKPVSNSYATQKNAFNSVLATGLVDSAILLKLKNRAKNEIDLLIEHYYLIKELKGYGKKLKALSQPFVRSSLVNGIKSFNGIESDLAKVTGVDSATL